jgi:transposase
VFKLAKASAVKARIQTINQLKAVLVVADPALRGALSGLSTAMLIRHCAQRETTTPPRCWPTTASDPIPPQLCSSPPATTPIACAARPPSPRCAASVPGGLLGKTIRHRLNRGDDRQANAALYRIALSRLRWDTRIRDYLARRITEGKTRREAIRCLKRYLAREIYQILTTPPEPQPSAAWHP